jgi:Spy/CpxP family protein refolding chaperone
MSTDQRQQMRDQMKKAMENMTPEQRKQLRGDDEAARKRGLASVVDSRVAP